MAPTPTRRSRRAAAAMCAVLIAASACGTEPAPVVPSGIGQTSLPPAITAAPAAGGPVRVDLAGTSTPVVPVKTTADGALLPPPDVRLLGWWVDSALPGGPGVTVIAGHIDDVEQGVGAAARFVHLAPGDEVTLTAESGAAIRYRITGVDSYDKRTELPVAELNRLDGPPTLALVTCGGPFVGGALGYQDNDIAWAVPLS